MLDRSRCERVYEAMEAEGIDQLIISDWYSVRYLTGRVIRPGERMLVLLLKARQRKAELILSRLFPQEAEEDLPLFFFDDTDDPARLLSGRLDEGKVIGVDKNWPARFLLPLMEQQPDKSFVNGSPLIDEIRQVKTGEEQEKMRKASQLNDQAMGELIGLVNKGYSEEELAGALEKIYLKLGSPGFSFTPICCYGANAADPHHMNDGTKGRPGDSVILDIGCLWQGYCSDMTRTVFLGEVGEEQRKVYEIVREANRRGIEAVRPGVRFCDVDAAARDYIAGMGYGEYFVHRTGHNIGQEVHEYGDVSSANEKVLKPGMIFSIEPGIYLPGRFGVRIEDLVLVTETGAEVLNKYPKELTVVPLSD